MENPVDRISIEILDILDYNGEPLTEDDFGSGELDGYEIGSGELSDVVTDPVRIEIKACIQGMICIA